MANLATQSASRAGITPTFAAATGGGDQFTPSRKSILIVKNGGGGSINVTLTTHATLDGEPVTDRVVAVANGSEKWIGNLDPQMFADPTDGLGDIAYSGVTSVTVAVVEVP